MKKYIFSGTKFSFIGLSIATIMMLPMIISGGCKSSEDPDYYPGPEGSLRLKVSTTDVRLNAYNASAEIMVESNSKWNVVVKEDKSWLNIPVTSGEANGSFIISAQNNSSQESRQATITVSGPTKSEDITVTQATAELYVTPDRFSCQSEGGEQEFRIISSSPWTLRCYENWINLNPVSGEGKGEESFKAVIASNLESSEIRTGKIFIDTDQGTLEVSVTQMSNSLPIVYVSPESHTLSVSSQGGNVSMMVMSLYPWKINSYESWLSLDKTTGNGNYEEGYINIHVDANNNSSNSRTATIFVTGLNSEFQPISVTLTQASANAPLVEKPTVSNISSNSADVVCNYINESEIKQKGIILSTSPDFSSDLRRIEDTSSDNDRIKIHITGLSNSTTYYVKGFVRTVSGIEMVSESISFKTYHNKPEAGDNILPE